MGLQEKQNFLAKLCTDSDFRVTFMADPVAIGSTIGLSPKEAEEMAAVSADEIEFFADSLFWKRLHEVEKLLPTTTRLLGGEFRRQFRTFAAGYNPSSIKKHLDDAVEFCEFLRRTPAITPAARDAAKFERAKLSFYSRNRRFLFAFLRHSLAVTDSQRWTITVWWRFRGKVHRFTR